MSQPTKCEKNTICEQWKKQNVKKIRFRRGTGTELKKTQQSRIKSEKNTIKIRFEYDVSAKMRVFDKMNECIAQIQ